MKFTIQAAKLAAALKPVCAVVNSKSPMDALRCVRLEAQSNTLSLAGTDLECQVSLVLEIEGVEEDGVAVVDADKLKRVVSALPPTADLLVETQKQDDQAFNLQRLTIKFGRSRYHFDCGSVDDYPEYTTETTDDNREISLNFTKTELLGLLSEVQWAMAKQDVRYYLKGVLFEIKDGVLTVVATDGHRLSCTSMPTDAGDLEAIVAGATVKTLQSLPLPDQFTITLTASQISLTSDKLSFASKLIDGKYPDYRRVIPDNIGMSCATLDAKSFKDAITRLSAAVESGLQGLKKPLQMSFAAGQDLEVRLSVGESGSEVIMADSYDGEEMDLCFNIDYMSDAVGVVDGEKIMLFVQDAQSSLRIQYKQEQIAVLMPLRV